jgi:predicted Zn-dependent protease
MSCFVGRPLRAAALVAALAAAVSSCARNPVSGTADFVLMSEAEELRLGQRSDQDVKKQYALYDNPGRAGGAVALAPPHAANGTDSGGLQAYVEAIGRKLAKASHRPALEYRFTVLDSSEINAFALPGGYIYITRGIIAYLNSEAELAAVLGHEIGHVTARHSVRQASAAQGTDLALNILSIFAPPLRSSGVQNVVGLGAGALFAGYGRDMELEADRLGAEYLARSGYDPNAMIRVVGVLKNQELFDTEVAKQEGREPRAYHGLFATHPDNDRRLQEVIGEAKKHQVTNAADPRAPFLAKTDGLVFGDSAREGVLRDGNFYHGDLGIAFRLPAGWRARNQPDRLVMQSPQGDAQLVLTSAKKESESPADTVRRLSKGRAKDIELSPIGGLPAALAADASAFGAVIHHGDHAYVFGTAFKSEDAWRRHADDLRATIRSFHAITPEEKAKSRATAIRLIKADGNTRMADLAKRSPLGRHAEGYLRLINGLYPSGEPKAGDLVKVIE